RMSHSIPIQNIYFLLCYAWNKLDEGETIDVSGLDSIELADLFALVLTNGIRHLLRRGLDRDYLAFSEETPRIRGRINFPVTIKRNLLPLRRPLCEFDELSYDVLHNRILKTTINRLLRLESLDRQNKESLWETSRWLREVSTVHLTSQIFRRVQLHRNNSFYRFLLNVCELIHESLLVDETTGKTRFRDFLRDEGKMRTLFEEFVRNFYRIRQNEFTVSSRKLKWNIESDSRDVFQYIPEMRTDICLEAAHRQIVLDCKFAKEIFTSYFGKESLKPGHLYQLYTYLKHAKDQLNWTSLEGILLYPVTRYSVQMKFKVDGFPFQIRTIDLNQNWKQIERDLLQIIA
ncbi:MAG: 5-methylcytosine-specific restriction endonuclease system specificity protein McrC, partial [Acidobacteria bacterium]|nr:5-methylcytosine-specific restriction endonuclease system specificity protein McrC [Acidobacteriota bacterium]